MVSSASSHAVSWAWQPAPTFPAKDWLEERFPFRIPTPLARLVLVRPAGWADAPRREFPVKRWLRERQG